ncbi:MAG TPA: cobalamin-independent methionine synthase [Candidatus Dietzia intestinipullorum]|nr:cobalamin-independent methionine synthase [Candidatus Dietzia intestinipullorum]
MRVAHSGPGPVRGGDPREVARAILGECYSTPFLPELPDRGPGADEVGRTAAMLTDLPVDASPRGWRLAGSPGRLSRRAVDFLDRDSDALEEADELARDPDDEPGGAGRRLLVRALGPWSLAARLEMPGGPSVLTDRGARRDVAASLAEGVAVRAVRLSERMRSRARVLLDEPALWHVHAGTVATQSRLDPVAAVPADQLSLSLCRFADALRAAGVDEVLARVPAEAGPDAPARWSILAEPPRDETPLDGLCLDSGVLHSARSHGALDAAGTVLGQGRLLQLEGLPGTAGLPTTGPEVERAVSRILDLLERLSAPRYAGLGQLVLTPSVEEMTSAGARPADALAAVRLVAEAAPRLAE